jgi:hypothetical protein
MTAPEAPYRSAEKPPGYPLYVSSGRTPITGLVLGLGAGTLAALFLSVLYAYGTLYIPIVQVEFLLTIGFGAAVGASTSGVMHRFHVRNRAIVIGACVVLGAFAWAFSWLPWLYGTLSRFGAEATLEMLFDPVFVGVWISRIYENGTWGIGSSTASSSSSTVSGAMLGIVWLGEAAAIVGFSTLVGVNTSKDRVFCEACDTWCTIVADRARYDLEQSSALRAGLVDRADLGVLSSTPAARAPDRWLALKLGFCPGCGETGVFAIEAVQRKVDNKGNVSFATTPHLPFRCVPRGEMRALRDQFRC